MFLVWMFFLLSLTIIILILNITPMINIHKNSQREKKSPFECGFDPLTKFRVPFSIHFFSISLMFLIFDIEITMIIPMPLMMNLINMNMWMSFNMLMMSILILGLALEWKEGSMEWK
uniref:NADH-ubiquinone oxidoreductase chain 3 n=1 Tax=Trioza remota TaxID=1715813 RepID=A0A344A2V9_9HEMI|nr:NADH dehydrogenase subunit 3 [Trioza remota]AWU49100.1 NADH dehydrogenase subunit 3 [Trioza remota]